MFDKYLQILGISFQIHEVRIFQDYLHDLLYWQASRLGNCQHALDQILDPLLNMNVWRKGDFLVHFLNQNFEIVHFGPRKKVKQNLIENDPTTPHVALYRVGLAQDDLWGHVDRGSFNNALNYRHLCFRWGCFSFTHHWLFWRNQSLKFSQLLNTLSITIFADEDIFGFYVAMENPLFVKVLASFGDLIKIMNRLVLRHMSFLDKFVFEVAIGTELKEKINVIGGFWKILEVN